MLQPMAIWRLIGAAVALVLIVLTVHFAMEYRRLDRAFHEWQDARPVSMQIDLSKTGRTTAPFNQTCQVSHGEAVYLTVSPSEAEISNLWTALKGLKAKMLIHDAAGVEVVVTDIEGKQLEPEGHRAMLASFAPFENGDYTLTIDVAESAVGLTGVPQTLHGQYMLCGLEQMPAMVCAMFCGGAGVISLIVGLVVGRGFWKHGLRRATSATGGREGELS